MMPITYGRSVVLHDHTFHVYDDGVVTIIEPRNAARVSLTKEEVDVLLAMISDQRNNNMKGVN